jgi:hypothetical protein
MEVFDVFSSLLNTYFNSNDTFYLTVIKFQISTVIKVRVSGLRQQVIWLAHTNILEEFLPLSSGYVHTYIRVCLSDTLANHVQN